MNNKLKPKAGSASITQIAAILRDEPSKSIDLESSNAQTENEEAVENTSLKQVNDSPALEFSEILEAVRQRKYECKEVLYVDKEIKEIFSLLKAKVKIPISPLVSYILEEWLQRNGDAIQKMIKQNTNRFLD